MGLKQAIIVRTDMRLTKGNIVASTVLASLSAAKMTKTIRSTKLDKWFLQGQMKVVLKVSSLEEFEMIEKNCRARGIAVARAVHGGVNQVKSDPVALGIGPDSDRVIDRLTGHLKLL